MTGPHLYQTFSLATSGFVLGLVFLVLYSLMFFKPEPAKAWAKKLPRHHQAGTYAMAIGMIWFWLLIAPTGKGFLSALTMDLGEFTPMKPYLQLAVPLFCIGMIVCVREFLFVRGLGLCLLMASAPLLYAADYEDAPMRFLMPTVCYIMIVKGLFFVGMPYLFRDGMNWLLANDNRWRAASLGGMILGLVFVILGLTVWRGH